MKYLSKAGDSIDDFQKRLSRAGSYGDRYSPKVPSNLNPNASTPLLSTPSTHMHSGHTTTEFSTLARTNSAIIKPQSDDKLGTFEGVYIQVVLSIWGVILFLRLGYILGQVGLIVTISMFIVGYMITTFTSLSIAAISTNGLVRGGGPYYMISRSLGPEFGGSIGVVVYLGTVLNGVLNALASVEGLIEFFGSDKGTIFKLLPEQDEWLFVYGTMALWVSIGICCLGSKLVSKLAVGFGVILLISTISILLTFLFRSPFTDLDRHIIYTSFSSTTLYQNLWPQLGLNELGIKETFQSMFGVLFPACIGIMAGASMSGNLKNPSRSIPKGTLWGIFSTFIAYMVLTVMFAATVSRVTLKEDINVMTHIGLFPPLVNIGVLATSISSTFSCFVGASKILQAMARDNLIPLLGPFGYGTRSGDEPLLAFLLTYALAQAFLLIGEINLVAGIVSMFFVLTFGVTNLACFLLKLGAAPNFRPSFKYFNRWTALVGVILCFGAMIYVSPISALLATTFAGSLFALVHFTSPPKPWGDVTQSLIYHQVRKYLLRLDSRKDHVKFWRPQILLLVNDPRHSYQLIQFCNYLKKGSLYCVGHILKGDLKDQLGELKRQRQQWLKLVDKAKIKAFIELTVADNERLGARSLLLTSGLGGMVPNIIMMGQFNLVNYRRKSWSRLDEDGEDTGGNDSSMNKAKVGDLLGPLPTDEMKSELPIKVTNYVSIVEDTLLLGKAVGITTGLSSHPLSPLLPPHLKPNNPVKTKKYIDLWPIQMATPRSDALISTNFDSYTMVLQLGCIIHMIKQWQSDYILRVCCFVEHRADVDEEHHRVNTLLENLRIPAQLKVFWLDNGAVEEYDKLFGFEAFNQIPTTSLDMPSNQFIQPTPSNTFIPESLRINIPIPTDHGQYAPSIATSLNSDSDDTSEYTDLTPAIDLPPPTHQPKNFNELPAQHQYKILNNLIRLQSSNTALLFSTLPAPEQGCSDNEESSLAYVKSLDWLTTDLPPSVLVHSKSLTVTTSL